MTDSTRTARDIAMKGAGYYSKATIGAKHAIDGATPLVLAAIERMNVGAESGVFTMADMGCADGGTSIDLVRAALSDVRRRAPSRPIRMIYTDLPRNDFSQLFRVVHGQTEIESYCDDVSDLYVFASATSFHQPMFPPDSLNLGFSATASHYISEKPGDKSDHVHMVGATGAQREAYEAQGAGDWERMLVNRTRELAPGGRLVLLNFGIDEEGRYLGNTGGVSMFDTFNEIWAAFADAGVITRQEYLNTNFPQCYRTVEQFTAPLTDPANPASKAGLRLEHAETRIVPCPYARDFGEHGDAAKFAREYIPTLRSWSESIFFAGLSEERPVEERRAIVDRFYATYEERVRDAPAGHGMDYVYVLLVCEKI